MYSAFQLADWSILPSLYFSPSDKSLALFLCCLVTLIRFYFQEKCCLHSVQTYLRSRKMLHYLTVQSSLLLNWLLNSLLPILSAFFIQIHIFSLFRNWFFFLIIYHLCFSWLFTSYIMYFCSFCMGSFNNSPYAKFIP